MRKVLVTGGCGYIGSHTMVDLIQNGFEAISVDNFSNAHHEVVQGMEQIVGKSVINYDIDLCDYEKTRQIFIENPDIEGVIHFAAFKSVAESVQQPLAYFHNNLQSLVNLLRCVEDFGVKQFVFSSSCSVYGNATELPVTENTPRQAAESPYARTKQMGEDILLDFAKVNPKINCILLRYFNPAGAHTSNEIGETALQTAIYLVPVINEAVAGKRAELVVYGTDYPTRDGSCLRDFIHVMDLADAHTKALQYVAQGENDSNYEIYNLGCGEGVTVLEAIKAFERANKRKVPYRLGERRAGDVVAIYANNELAKKRLHWTPRYSIDDIMRTAWAWEQKQTQMPIATA